MEYKFETSWDTNSICISFKSFRLILILIRGLPLKYSIIGATGLCPAKMIGIPILLLYNYLFVALLCVLQ